MTGRSEWGDSHNRLIVCRDISTTHYVHRYNMLLGQPHTFFISIFHNCITPPRSDAWRVLTLPEDLSVAGFLPLSCLPARDIHLHTHPTGLRICEAECGSRWKGKASIGTPDMPHNALEGYRRFQMNVTREERYGVTYIAKGCCARGTGMSREKKRAGWLSRSRV